MTYAYRCGGCSHQFDVIKSVKDMERPEKCARCGTEATREFVPRRTFLNKTAVQHAEYNPGLGCVVNNSYHRSEICKARGLEEIGSEPVENLHKTYEKKRKEMRQEAWAKLDDGLDPRIEAQVTEELEKRGGVDAPETAWSEPA